MDAHTHAMPLTFLRLLRDRGLADLSSLAEGYVRIDPAVAGVAAGSRIPCPPSMWDVAARSSDPARPAVGRDVVAAPPFLFAADVTDDVTAADLVARSNDALAEFVAPARDRFLPLGTVPVGRRAAVAEAARVIDSLGFVGVTLGTTGAARDLDDPVNEPLWSWLAERRVPVLLHPTGAPAPQRMRDFHLTQLLGYPVETAIAAARLIFSGVLDRHDLSIVLCHGGGCLPSLTPRLDLGWQRKEVARTTPTPPSSYLGRFWFDTATFDDAALRALIDRVGADHVLLGTDYPFDLGDTDGVARVERLGLDPDRSRSVLGGTAAGLFGLAPP
mgnify:FL=1